MKPNILFVNLVPMPLNYIQRFMKGLLSHFVVLVMPMGILYLSSYLKAHNNVGKIELLDFPLHYNELIGSSSIEAFIESQAKKYVNFNPHIIAISLMFSTSHVFFDMTLKILKSIFPNALIVVGGMHASNCPKHLLKYDDIDYVVLGEGEIAFSEMVGQYANNEKISVKGVYNRMDIETDKLLLLADAPKELDQLPLPDYDLIDMKTYSMRGHRKDSKGSGMKSASIMTSRGCPHMCTFCASHTIHGRRVRYHSVERVLEEINLLNNRYGILYFTPADDHIISDKKRFMRLYKEIKKLNIPNLTMDVTNGFHINSLNEEILDAIVDLGTKHITLPLESGSEYVQKNIIKKHVNLVKAKEIVALCRKKGVLTTCNVIFGFPGEAKELMEESADYVGNLGADWVLVIIATPLIGSELYKQCIEKGYIEEEVYLRSIKDFNERGFDTDEISAVDLKEWTYRFNLSVNFINNYNMRNGNYKTALHLFENIVKDYPFHIFGYYGIYRIHKNQGNEQAADEVIKKANKVLSEDSKAKELYEEYKDLFPEKWLQDSVFCNYQKR
ncbi:MAG: radical SAM protein [Candidatus Saganbacteria bacterium]|nr:radical SAM protein [Candidatus Saganbacteria bacterium]